MRSNSLFRALRVDKLTYAALEATLLAYLRQQHDSIPALRMMHLSQDSIRLRAEALRQALSGTHLETDLLDGESLIGGGAAPSATLPTCLLSIQLAGLSATGFATRLRRSEPPIIARIEDNLLLLDLRTVFPEQDALLIAALQQLHHGPPINNRQSQINNS
jgi:L-seryl-tRNA(Ser) seleniumtransferase